MNRLFYFRITFSNLACTFEHSTIKILNADMETLYEYLNQIFKVNQSEWNLLRKIIEYQKFETKQLLVQQGQVSKYIYFIKDGFLRVFHLHEGKKISTYFACDGQFISTFESLITQKPSSEYLEAISH